MISVIIPTLNEEASLPALLDAIRQQDEQQVRSEGGVLFDLVHTLTSHERPELSAVRDDLEKLATSAKQPVTRQLGFVALIAADGSVDRAWTLATKSLRSLQDLVSAMPLLSDPSLRAALYPKVVPLLDGSPKELASSGAAGKPVLGRYVRIELPGRSRTLTLAEVEVFSEGRNVARQGKATQSSTAFDGAASRGIDGITSGDYSRG